MLTQCPQCQTIYQLGAAELSAARGYVECGECGYQFSALDRIADDPTFDEKKPPSPPDPKQNPNQDLAAVELSADSTASDSEEKSPPLISLVDEDQITPPAEEHFNDDPAPAIEQNLSADLTQQEPDDLRQFESDPDPDTEPQHDMDTTVELALLDENDDEPAILPTGSSTTLPADEHEILFTEPEISADESLQSEQDNFGSGDNQQSTIDLDEVPPILQEELLALKDANKTPTRWYWSVLAIVLLVGLVVQGAWFYRQELLSQFPEARKPLGELCEKIGCEIQAVEPDEPIQLVSRDVRTHPRYKNALLVNASLVNSGSETTDFPTVQLGLFDNTGTALGIRQFSPSEYLDKSIDITAGIPPGRSVHVVMELANAGERASSFEFSFR